MRSGSKTVREDAHDDHSSEEEKGSNGRTRAKRAKNILTTAQNGDQSDSSHFESETSSSSSSSSHISYPSVKPRKKTQNIQALLLQREIHSSNINIKKFVENKFENNVRHDNKITKEIKLDTQIRRNSRCNDFIATLDVKNNVILWDISSSKKIWKLTVAGDVTSDDEMDQKTDANEKLKVFENGLVLIAPSNANIKIALDGSITGEIKISKPDQFYKFESIAVINNRIVGIIGSRDEDSLLYAKYYLYEWNFKGEVLSSIPLSSLGFTEEYHNETNPRYDIYESSYVISNLSEKGLSVFIVDIKTRDIKKLTFFEKECQKEKISVDAIKFFEGKLIVSIHYLGYVTAEFLGRMVYVSNPRASIFVFDVDTSQLHAQYKPPERLGSSAITNLKVNENHIVFFMNRRELHGLLFCIDLSTKVITELPDAYSNTGDLYLHNDTLVICHTKVDYSNRNSFNYYRRVMDLNTKTTVDTSAFTLNYWTEFSYSNFGFLSLRQDDNSSSLLIEDFQSMEDAELNKAKSLKSGL